MAWRESFLSRFGPGVLGGITPVRWFRILRENRFAVPSRYWGRAAAITMGSLPNGVFAGIESLAFGRKVRATEVEAPLFILGIWRSGTTHLHNLLAQDGRFAYPNNYQVCYPRTFLTTERFNARFVGAFLPEKRPQDNVAMGIREPQEDEFALCSLTGRTPSMAWAFPARAEHYRRYLTFREAPPGEVAEWKAEMAGFVRKLAFKHRRPIVLKSPGHTGRIRLLLELFPDARFVHIRRDPFTVFRSTLHMIRSVSPWFALQTPDFADMEDRVIRQYEEVYRAYFEERGLIPEGRLHEVGFEDLEADPVGRLRALYEALRLPDFAAAEPRVRDYLESVSSYKKNAFADLPDDLRSRIATRWRRCFEEWGYPT